MTKNAAAAANTVENAFASDSVISVLGDAAYTRLDRNSRLASDTSEHQNRISDVPSFSSMHTEAEHPGALIRAELKKRRLTISDAAEGLQVNRQHFHKVLNGESSITADMAVRLEKGLGGKAEYWLGRQKDYELAQARRRDINVHAYMLRGRPPKPA